MLYIILSILLAVFILYAFTRSKKKSQDRAVNDWHTLLKKHVDFYKRLDKKQQAHFRKRMQLFLDEIYVEGVEIGLTELDYVLVAASAVIPVFGFGEWHYNNLSGVLIYPDSFNEDLKFHDSAADKRILGMVGTGQFEGQMILSRKALHHGFNNKTDKLNTGIHEFVHLIDKTDGLTDGLPERLIPYEYAMPWLALMHKEMEAINKNESDLRSYGGTNQQEFLAVAAEYFFERPKLLKRKLPELYKMLEDCFQSETYT
ncbi:Phenylalanyl-tRNA synthetase, alpha subunit [unidentified eubacterium SCB49]|nr:Phenylalanyl-tRNA synthetase, alpha subunit [unidentified eubacterium SCB49]